jgi:hypothetical protein
VVVVGWPNADVGWPNVEVFGAGWPNGDAVGEVEGAEVWPNAGAELGCSNAEVVLLVTPKAVCPNPGPVVGLNALGLPKAELVEVVVPNAD